VLDHFTAAHENDQLDVDKLAAKSSDGVLKVMQMLHQFGCFQLLYFHVFEARLPSACPAYTSKQRTIVTLICAL
jgi:hypothetical protein